MFRQIRPPSYILPVGRSVRRNGQIPGSASEGVAGPLRFRHARGRWDRSRVDRDLLGPLDAAIGATIEAPWFTPPEGYEGVRFEMRNGDFALFCWTDGQAYWMGNTQTPEVLWRTEKYTFEEVPYPVARWAQRELIARIEVTDPWLTDYEYVTWFFLPVFLSKDGRDTTRRFFAEHAAGFPDATREEGLAFYESVLRTGVLDEYRYTMAAKLGTSQGLDVGRMAATMGEFTVAKILHDAGHEFEPEIELGSGHALDYRVDGQHLVEVTRPRPPTNRRTNSPVAAVKETGKAKTTDQLRAHPGTTLFVDCTSFPDDDWKAVAGERPQIGYKPVVVFRARPGGRIEGYHYGTLPFSLDDAIEWVDR
jgi:hypothetical protein